MVILYDICGCLLSFFELDSKLIFFFKSIRSRGGVVNFCVVKVIVLVFVNSNNISGLRGFEFKFIWVRFIYKRCNFIR